jgi:hypothetical protein
MESKCYPSPGAQLKWLLTCIKFQSGGFSSESGKRERPDVFGGGRLFDLAVGVAINFLGKGVEEKGSPPYEGGVDAAPADGVVLQIADLLLDRSLTPRPLC